MTADFQLGDKVIVSPDSKLWKRLEQPAGSEIVGVVCNIDTYYGNLLGYFVRVQNFPKIGDWLTESEIAKKPPLAAPEFKEQMIASLRRSGYDDVAAAGRELGDYIDYLEQEISHFDQVRTAMKPFAQTWAAYMRDTKGLEEFSAWWATHNDWYAVRRACQAAYEAMRLFVEGENL